MKRLWSTYLSKWLDRRIPPARSFKLDLRSIFIFPSGFGWLFLILCVAFFFLGTNYQNNLMLLLCYFLLAIFLVNLLLSYLNFSRLSIQLGKLHPPFAGDNLAVPLWLHNEHDVLATSHAHGLFSLSFWREKQLTWYDSEQSGNPVSLDYLCTKRGKLTLPRITISSQYPLGFYRCWTHLAFNSEVIVYPKPLPCELIPVLQEATDDDGQLSSTDKGHEDFDSLKAYQKGESLHHVAWKQVAKGRGMVSKSFSDTRAHTTQLSLASVKGAGIEQKLSQLCYLVLQLSQQHQVFSLRLDERVIQASTGSAHQQICLEALALYREHSSS